MASYRGHLSLSTAVGVGYAGLAMWQFGVTWPVAGVGGLLTALAGLLPDLDSSSGVPVRELFGLAGALLPLFLLREAGVLGMTPEETLLSFAGLYFGIRYGLSELFRRVTVHRGMFHSVPAMLIAGLLVYVGYRHPDPAQRAFLAVGAMLGFLSHLVLDEVCAVDFRGVVPRLNAFAGSALKFTSKSMTATVLTYALMAALAGLAWVQHQSPLSPTAGETLAREAPAAAIPRVR